MPTTAKLPRKKAKSSKASKTSKTSKTPKRTTEPIRMIRDITFFGDSAIPGGDAIYESVFQAAKFLAKSGYGIVNGGGPGIMKAATDGAESVDGRTVAVYWQPKLASFFEGRNLANITDESSTSSNYLIRTLGLIEKGDAYVVCKGGTGTISELGMVWALAKLYYGCHKPVILYGDFWDELIESFKKAMYIDEVELSVLYQATTPEELLKILKEHESKIEKSCQIVRTGDEAGFILSLKEQEEPEKRTKREYNRVASAYHSDNIGRLVAKEQLEEFFSLVNPPAKVLDVGTGPGNDLKVLADKYSVTGIEISSRFAEIARFENPGIDIVNTSIVDYDLPKNTYKGIWARDSLHHIKSTNLDDVFTKLSDSLVEEGVLYIIVREGVGEIMEVEKKSYDKVKRFYHLFSANELIDRAERANLELVKIDRTQRSHKWLVGVFRKKVS